MIANSQPQNRFTVSIWTIRRVWEKVQLGVEIVLCLSW